LAAVKNASNPVISSRKDSNFSNKTTPFKKPGTVLLNFI
jgi:hypothetical protein